MSLLDSIQSLTGSFMNPTQGAQGADMNAQQALQKLRAGVEAEGLLPGELSNFDLSKLEGYGSKAMEHMQSLQNEGQTTASPVMSRSGGGAAFGQLLEQLVDSVDAKSKVASDEVQKLMLGESDNLHQAMIAMQESGVAFNLLVEVRNKLVEAYQELTRMSA